MAPASTKRANVVAIALAFLLVASARSSEEKRLAIYSPVATYNLAVVDRSRGEYVGILELLEPLGRVAANSTGGHWRLRFNRLDSEFVAGRTRARIGGHDFDLAAPFLIENARGLVPVASLGSLLPRFTGNSVSFHESGRRLFIGDVAIQVTGQVDAGNPSRLVMNFSNPVNPTIATEPGKLRMVFHREPVVAPQNVTPPAGSSISQVDFSETNGAAELSVSSATPLMANFSNNGRTITITAASSSAGPAPPIPPPQAPGVSLPASPTLSATPAPPVASPLPLVVVDASHGGSERGAALSDTLAEKNVTLGFARLLRHELEQQGFSVLMLREGDDSLTLDQRAGTANAANASLYITLHGSSQGRGARVYTALLPPEIPGRGPFRDWNTAQSSSLSLSQAIAAGIAASLGKHDLTVAQSAASLRPLNNLLMPAVAVELAPGPNGTADLTSANYQQKAAAAIADAVAGLRDRLGARP